ncbi:MAG TPA: hypothetical protein VGJ73_15260 [Verrucomicrobiae bacterium]|jgi:hypothetical protein
MSVLNDALKRASQSQQLHEAVRINLNAPSAPSRELLRELPHELPLASASTRAGPGWTIPVLLLLGVGTAAVVAFLFFGRGVHVRTTTAVPSPVRATSVAPKPSIIIIAAPAPKPVPAARPSPRLKLQGITYSYGKWQAIVNGKTVYVGDRVKGFRVAAIYRNGVSFISPDGSAKRLVLGQ